MENVLERADCYSESLFAERKLKNKTKHKNKWPRERKYALSPKSNLAAASDSIQVTNGPIVAHGADLTVLLL